MDNIKISLAIFGNQNSNSGFQPLYWINNPPQQLENIVPPGMDENPYFFTLQVLSTHTQYTLIHNHVSSYMSVRPGVLKMAIAIPKGYSIRDGVSPLEVLLDIRQQFMESCMTLRDAQTEAYNYKEKLPDSDIFARIVNSYQLVPDSQTHLPMSGSEDAVMLLDEMAIAQLFVAPQHPEFQRFRSIVIAQKGNTSAYKTQLNGMMATAMAANAVTSVNQTASSTQKPNVSKTVPSTSKPAKKKTYILLLLVAMLVIASAVFILMPTSDKKTEKQRGKEVVESTQKEHSEAEEEEQDIDEQDEMTAPSDEMAAPPEEMPAPLEEKKEMEEGKQPVNISRTPPMENRPNTPHTQEKPTKPKSNEGKNNGELSADDIR